MLQSSVVHVAEARQLGATKPAPCLEAAIRHLQSGGLELALDTFGFALTEPPQLDQDELNAALVQLVLALHQAFELEPRSPAAYRLIERIDPQLASTAADLFIVGCFPDGQGDPSVLSEAAILLCGGLLSAAKRDQAAVDLLSTRSALYGASAFQYAVFRACCRWTGAPYDIVSHLPPWSDRAPEHVTLDALADGADEAPHDLRLRRRLARRLIETGSLEQGLDQLAIAMALPFEDDVKSLLAEDLSGLAPVLIARGDEAILQRSRFRWALSACPSVLSRAEELIRARSAAGELPFLDAQSAKRVEAYLLSLTRERGLAAGGTPDLKLSPFPARGGKPHVDTVWLEITNFCNQKCGFCPDPFREEPRTWMPLADVKRRIDELADGVSVGSMQLNAYGEPLLHPDIAEILTYLRERRIPWPTYFTSHGLTLVEKKLKQLSNNYPAGIAISLHNDSQASYAATRSAKIGDYDTLVSRVSALFRQMVMEQADCHLRLYHMVCNGREDQEVAAETRAAFPSTPETFHKSVRAWEAIAAKIAAAAPASAAAEPIVHTADDVAEGFKNASHGDTALLPILRWTTQTGRREQAFISPRPVGTYANLLLEYDPKWQVKRKIVNRITCGFTAAPSLAIFASGRLGICCMDLNSTATFGALSDYADVHAALTSPEALRMFAQLSNGVTASRGCQICLGKGERV